MFEFLGRLFGSAAAGEKIVNGVVQAADKIWYTKEEQADAANAARSEGFQVYMEWLKSTSGSRVARRLIALIVTGIWALEHIASVTLGVWSVFISDLPAKVPFVEASEMLATHATNNNTLVGVVLLFYFGGPAAVDASRGLIEKWAGKKAASRG